MFKKKEKTEKAPKNKKVRTMEVGTHKKSVLLLWAVLLASTSFGVYKNFTAIDTHTIHEKEIIQLRLNDTNGIENFVKNFAKAYYSWDTSKEAIEARTTEISKYLTKELQDLSADTIRTDIPTSATVTNVLVWNVEQSGTDDFTVAYEVDQKVKEGEQTYIGDKQHPDLYEFKKNDIRVYVIMRKPNVFVVLEIGRASCRERV